VVLTATILILLTILAIVVFFRLAPQAKRFNIAVLAILLGLCVAITVWLRVDLKGTPDSAWWPVVAGFWSLAIVVVGLAVAALARHLGARRGLMPNTSFERTREE
jgi:hypothetical protein